MAFTEELRNNIGNNLRMMVSPITGVVWAFAVVLTVLAGPFGTYEGMAVFERALYWVPVVSLSVFVGYVVRGTTFAFFGEKNPIVFDLAASVIMTILFTPILAVITLSVTSLTDSMPPQFPRVILYTFAVAVAVFVSRRVVIGAEICTYPFLEDDPEEDEPRLLKRLSPEVRGRVLRISGQDHHVEIITEAGKEMLRLRLMDAIGEMDTVEGYCTHRSHWIARSAITGIKRENSHKITIFLSNGDSVPVSRKYKPELEEVGIL